MVTAGERETPTAGRETCRARASEVRVRFSRISLLHVELVVVVGNPKPASRTLVAAESLGGRIAPLVGADAIRTIDLAELGGGLLTWGDPAVGAACEQVRGAAALVVASPTYKAAYTGLLKLFLDQFGHDELAGMPTVAMMTGGGPAHSLAVEVHLRPVLVEIGASCPTRGLYLAGDDVINDPAQAIEEWLESAGPVLERSRRP